MMRCCVIFRIILGLTVLCGVIGARRNSKIARNYRKMAYYNDYDYTGNDYMDYDHVGNIDYSNDIDTGTYMMSSSRYNRQTQQKVADYDYDKDDYSGIPGKPNKDYPIFSAIPNTSFKCRSDGYWGDVEARCQVFHVCYGRRHWSFLCPNGTVFNQWHLVCVWWYDYDCDETEAHVDANNDLWGNKEPEKVTTGPSGGVTGKPTGTTAGSGSAINSGAVIPDSGTTGALEPGSDIDTAENSDPITGGNIGTTTSSGTGTTTGSNSGTTTGSGTTADTTAGSGPSGNFIENSTSPSFVSGDDTTGTDGNNNQYPSGTTSGVSTNPGYTNPGNTGNTYITVPGAQTGTQPEATSPVGIDDIMDTMGTSPGTITDTTGTTIGSGGSGTTGTSNAGYTYKPSTSGTIGTTGAPGGYVYKPPSTSDSTGTTNVPQGYIYKPPPNGFGVGRPNVSPMKPQAPSLEYLPPYQR